MKEMFLFKNKKNIYYQLLIFFFYTGSGIYSVTAIWFTYSLTKSPLVVSLIIVAGYLPSAIAGFTFSKVISKGDPYKKIQIGSLIMVLSMILLIFMLVSLSSNKLISLSIISITQILLSLIKLFNQSSFSLLVKTVFNKEEGKKVIEIASSNRLVSLSIGASIAGIILNLETFYLEPIISCFMFFCSIFSVLKLNKVTRDPLFVKLKGEGKITDRNYKVSFFSDKTLQTLILFSICSSGTLQYLNAILAPLADSIVENKPVYFSLLDVLCMVGGFIAGVLLSTEKVKSRFILDYGFLIIGIVSILLAFIHSAYGVAILVFILSLITTAHIICMQVKTNQIPLNEQVSEYAIFRNASGSIIKTTFSILAGIITTYFSIQSAWIALSFISILFFVIWKIFTPDWHG
ncbi:MFS transporter [Marinomonas sp. TI.3.20]|uniref:MFS transporter n=1 Tax=Marinomonas sp. TI.3.20 TaxID=3121296 RepID=UPI00311D3960